MGGPNTTPFNVNKQPSITTQQANEQKNEPNSLEEETKKLKIGSFTCLDVMRANSPLKRLEEAPLDQKDNVSVQTNSTFATQDGHDDIASDGDEDEDDAVFDMDM